jgi:hypothetical protein
MPTAKELSFLIGKWETKIVIRATEITPKEVTGKGVAEYRMFGQAIEGSRSSDTTNGHNEDRELIVYSPASNSYEMFAVNLRGIATQRTLSRYVNFWAVEYSGKMNDKDFRVRGTYKIISDNELQYLSEVNVENSGFKPFVEVTYQRVSKE